MAPGIPVRTYTESASATATATAPAPVSHAATNTSNQATASTRPPNPNSTTGMTTSTTTSTAGDSKSVTSEAATDHVKRGRKSKPKVKTGCTNCKQRRIKCDEKRPACTQCVRSHKECTGYPPPSRRAGPYPELRIAPKPVPLQASISSKGAATSAAPYPPLGYHTPKAAGDVPLFQSQGHLPASPLLFQPSARIPFNQADSQYFALFCERTAAELSGYFDNVFWTKRVLQECHNAPAIRHAVVALGALYKTMEQNYIFSHQALGDSYQGIDTVSSHWLMAIKQYSEACKAVMVYDDQSPASHKTRIMSSVLLACFDSFIGDHKQAIIQMQSGLSLMHQLQTDIRRRGSGREDQMGQELASIFMRLVFQAKSYDMAFHFPSPYTVQIPSTPPEEGSSPKSDTSSPTSIDAPVPLQFSTTIEARVAADQLNSRMGRLLERLHAARNQSYDVLPQSWGRYGDHIKAQLEGWSQAFEPIFQGRTAPDITPIEKQAIVALKMSQLNLQLLFLTVFDDNEIVFDAYMPHFSALLDLGREVVQDEEARAAAEQCPDPSLCPHVKPMPWDSFGLANYTAYHIKPSFSADLGIVPPLFVIATKCRDPVVRRRAIQLLRSSARREAMWDSLMVAKVSEWVMTIEEANMGLATIPRHIPEERRVMITSVDFDLSARWADVRLGTRGVRRGLPDERYQETHITW